MEQKSSLRVSEDQDEEYTMQSLPGVTATEMLKQEDWDTADVKESMMSSAIKLVISAAKPDRESISPRADKSDS